MGLARANGEARGEVSASERAKENAEARAQWSATERAREHAEVRAQGYDMDPEAGNEEEQERGPC